MKSSARQGPSGAPPLQDLKPGIRRQSPGSLTRGRHSGNGDDSGAFLKTRCATATSPMPPCGHEGEGITIAEEAGQNPADPDCDDLTEGSSTQIIIIAINRSRPGRRPRSCRIRRTGILAREQMVAGTSITHDSCVASRANVLTNVRPALMPTPAVKADEGQDDKTVKWYTVVACAWETRTWPA